MGARMRFPVAPSALAIVLVAAGSFALLRHSGASDSSSPASKSPTPPLISMEGLDEGSHAAVDERSGVLPPNHPPIGGGSQARPSTSAARDEAPALAWTAPGSWDVAPNASSMRLATYRLRAPVGDASSLEVTVTRAGGTPEANLDRWVGQFDKAGLDTRATRFVDGLRVSTLEVSGTYEGGMTSAGTDEAHPGWAMLGAIVETNGLPYFFKMVGPVAAVRAARPAFDGVLNSIKKIR
jgi:hypothetical protein